MAGCIYGEHAYTAAEPHANVEELHVKLAVFDVVPQRVFSIILNRVVSLWSQVCQRIRQRTRFANPRLLRQVMSHGLKHREIEFSGATIGNFRLARIGCAREERGN
ncbi:hypothetical protein D3C75_656540 [compost metagenome]